MGVLMLRRAPAGALPGQIVDALRSGAVEQGLEQLALVVELEADPAAVARDPRDVGTGRREQALSHAVVGAAAPGSRAGRIEAGWVDAAAIAVVLLVALEVPAWEVMQRGDRLAPEVDTEVTALAAVRAERVVGEAMGEGAEIHRVQRALARVLGGHRCLLAPAGVGLWRPISTTAAEAGT